MGLAWQKLVYVEDLRKAYEEILASSTCVQKSQMSVTGKDLIAMGMKPGKEMGQVLDQLFEAVLEDPEMNNKENLMALAHKLILPFI